MVRLSKKKSYAVNCAYKYPTKVRVVEVGPRDGLQNESKNIPTDVKVEFINRLSATGLQNVEATSFVSPKWVPQMADHSDVYSKIDKVAGVSYPVLVPNMRGLLTAMQHDVKEIAVFGSASEGFSQKNIGCSIAESLERFEDVVSTALDHGIKVRGYISCVCGCPYDGAVSPQDVAKISDALYKMGCYEISLGDTIGIGTPGSIRAMLQEVMEIVPVENLALHCHDTYGQALSNILTALEMGISVFDSSVAGLGGCPYARGASGNVATEDLIYMLEGMGIETGVDMDLLLSAGRYICEELGKSTESKVARALSGKEKPMKFLQSYRNQPSLKN
ncbi:hydroxymethylglutaryl-CoA lyase, mitochondrial isoform X2 [Aphis gossypii]|uniref:hydroxymethylglutaryl-CoA lyase, mitochondrial isoform X2 n=1 Tax=Aphis gossypii TaxID=80765 RepID=UPI0021590AEF|nr:hydroxymethylglutaryl-CoA lyase, mitochondrial isoform X2 [Aphis gossypii]